MKILFVDAKSSTPYGPQTLRDAPLGGTEASLVRVAVRLAATHDVTVLQRGRSGRERVGERLEFCPLEDDAALSGIDPDVVVILRKHRLVGHFHRRFPRARIVLWVCNFQRREVLAHRRGLLHSGCALVAMSQTHADYMDRLMNCGAARLFRWPPGAASRIAVRSIYNPIDDHLAPDRTPVDRDKLLFFSNLYKGFDQVVAHFRRARQRMPTLRLFVAGHAPADVGRWAGEEGVRFLGRLAHPEIIRHVRESLCVFYPQNRFAETFGLVFAEANAVGAPVMAHDLGAAAEILSSREQLVDAADPDAVVATLARWRDGARPAVRARESFRTARVAQAWERLLRDVADAPSDALSNATSGIRE